MLIKKDLAEHITGVYKGAETARAAREEFERVFSQKSLPDHIMEYNLSRYPDTPQIAQIMFDAKLAESKGEARRLIAGGGVYLDDERVTDTSATVTAPPSRILKVGKRRFLKLIRT